MKFVDAGMTHIVFVKDDGKVWVAGLNDFGESGIGSAGFSSAEPVQMIGINNAVRALALGAAGSISQRPATVILLNDGSVKITGGDDRFQATNSLLPVTVNGLNNIVDIKGGTTAVYALDVNGNVFSFGREGYTPGLGFPGVLGLGDNLDSGYIAPRQIIFPNGVKPIVALSANCDGYFGLALDSSHNVYAWGDNREGALGNGDPLNQNILTPQLVASNVIDIYAGETFSYILKSDNTLWASGNSGYNISGTDYGSIWMDLPNMQRNVYTQIHPESSPMNLCAPKPFGVLPVYLESFTCIPEEDHANIKWESYEESNLEKYEVEYSGDGEHFKQVFTVMAKGSNREYYVVHFPKSRQAFYKLKMIDKDGKFRYSQIRRIEFKQQPAIEVYPNPATSSISFISKNIISIPKIEVVNVNGVTINTIRNVYSSQLINIGNLPNGMYLLKLSRSDESIEFKKFFKF